MLEKDLCLRVIKHDFPLISLSIHSSHLEAKNPPPKKTKKQKHSAQLRKKPEKFYSSTSLKVHYWMQRELHTKLPLPCKGVWLSTNLHIFKGKGYAIHLNIWGTEAILWRCSAPKKYCKDNHWQGHNAWWTSVIQNVFSNQSRAIRQKNKVNLLENNGKIILWADTDLKSSENFLTVKQIKI